MNKPTKLSNSITTRPEDILPDAENYVIIGGIKARKGSVAAAIANAKILTSPSASGQEKQEAKQMIRELAPALVALGLYEQLVWKNPSIQQLMEEAAQRVKRTI